MSPRKPTRIAHISDTHILDPQRNARGHGLAVRFVSATRALDARARIRKLRRALEVAKRTGATHVVISGDLTETGTLAQFENLARELHDSGIDPERIILVPGNHDVYDHEKSWERAIDGPLAAFRRTSASTSRSKDNVVSADGVTFLPIDVTRHQSVAFSGGELSAAASERIERLALDPAFRDGAFVVVMHHPPFPRSSRVHQFVDGLKGFARVLKLMAREQRVQLLHGHLHYVVDKLIGKKGYSRVLGAAATVDDRDHARVRVYEANDDRLESRGLAIA